MTDNTNNLVLEQLRAICSDLQLIKEEQHQTRVEISGMGQQLAGLTTAFYGKVDRIHSLEHRVDRIEQRLELADDDGGN